MDELQDMERGAELEGRVVTRARVLARFGDMDEPASATWMIRRMRRNSRGPGRLRTPAQKGLLRNPERYSVGWNARAHGGGADACSGIGSAETCTRAASDGPLPPPSRGPSRGDCG
jgi:hypothetical protein